MNFFDKLLSCRVISPFDNANIRSLRNRRTPRNSITAFIFATKFSSKFSLLTNHPPSGLDTICSNCIRVSYHFKVVQPEKGKKSASRQLLCNLFSVKRYFFAISYSIVARIPHFMANKYRKFFIVI